MNDTDAGKDLKNHLLEDWKTAHNIWAHIRAYGDANWGGGGSTFLGLTDTPDSYTGQSLKGVRVNTGETALEFYTVGGGSNHAILSSTHTDATVGTVARGDLITGQGASPTWARLAKGTAGYILKTDSSDVGWAQLAGTSNQVTVTDGSGVITLSLPQDIHTGAIPKFMSLVLEKASGTVYLDMEDTSGASRKHIYLALDITNSKVVWNNRQEGVDFWPVEIGASRVHMIMSTGHFYIQGAADVSLLFSPSSGASKIGQIHQSGDAIIIGDYGVANLIFIPLPSGNIGIGASSFGTSATKTLAISSGTAPASSPADTVQLYSADYAASNAMLTIRTENATIIQLGNYTSITASGADAQILVRGNASYLKLKADTDYYAFITFNSGASAGTDRWKMGLAETSNSFRIYDIANSTARITIVPAGLMTLGGDVRLNSFAELTEISAPSTPASGYGRLYVKTDGKIYFLNDGATEYDLTLGGGAVGAHNFLDSTYHNNTLTGTPVLGDLIHGNTTPAWAKLAGNITTTKQFLSQTGSGSVSAVPVWATILQANVSGLTTSDSPQFTKLSLGEASPSAVILNVSGTTDAGAADAYGIYLESTLHTNTTQGTIGLGINPVHNAATGESIGYAYGLWVGLQSKTGTGTVNLAVGAYINSPTIGTANNSLVVTGSALATFAPAVRFSSYQELAEISAPSTPSSGYARLYAKSDNKPYWLDDTGTETCLIGASGGGKSKSQGFTSDGTWTLPTGVTLVWVTGTGGGGGGEAGVTSTRGGGAGGTGEYWYRYPITVSANVTVTLGTAGTAGTGSSGANGGNGGSTTFGALLTMLGGGGGGINGSGYGGNGGGALGLTGALSAGSSPTGKGGHYFPGASGGGGAAATPSAGYAGGTVMKNSGGQGGASTYGGGGGGSTFYGNGGTGGTSGVAGATPTSTYYGAGGGGGYGGATYTNGGAGIKGYVLVEWIEA